jgi:LPXTG-motif cell wall-anchored protein
MVASAARTDEAGSPTTLVAGLGLVGLLGGAAAYVALRRRTDG